MILKQHQGGIQAPSPLIPCPCHCAKSHAFCCEDPLLAMCGPDHSPRASSRFDSGKPKLAGLLGFVTFVLVKAVPPPLSSMTYPGHRQSRVPAGEGWASETHQVSFADGPPPAGSVAPPQILPPLPAFIPPAGAVPGVSRGEVCVTRVLEGGCPDFLLPPLRLGWRREGEAWGVLISPLAISAGHCPLQGQLCPAGVPTAPFL